MWLPQRVFDAIVNAYESRAKEQSGWTNNFLTMQHQQSEEGLRRVLAAKDAEVRAIIAAKDAQIVAIREEADFWKAQTDHERGRAEAAIDQGIQRLGGTAIRDEDLRRTLAEKEVAGTPLGGKPLPPELKTKEAEMQRIFKELASVGEDGREPEDGPLADRLVFVGGHPV